MRSTFLLAGTLLATACYSENLNLVDLKGTIVVPREAATQAIQLPGATDVTDVVSVANIGPVYVGLYSSINYSVYPFPSPERGPASPPTAFPYSGTTVGDFRYACFEFFSCKITSGRWASYDEMIDWFTDVLGEPPLDNQDREITVGDYIRQECFDLLEVTSDAEIRLLPPDRNEDGVLDAADLDFVENENGDFVGTFSIPQTDFTPGLAAWAFMDAPNFSAPTFYKSCSTDRGYNETTYDRNFRAGGQLPDVLNRPWDYLELGDYAAGRPYTWDDPTAEAEIVLDFEIGVDNVTDFRPAEN